MKKHIAHIAILFFLFHTSPLLSQYNGHSLGISFSYSYTTESKLYQHPTSSDFILREQFDQFDDIYSYAVEGRYLLSENLALGLSLEFVERFNKNYPFFLGSPSGSNRIIIKEGYRIIPVEISLYYLLPFSTNTLKFHMGGGIGYYYGDHIRKINNVNSETVEREFAFGIHVNTGMDYIINRYFSIRGEMKFRDPEIDLSSRYEKETVHIDNKVITLTEKEFDSRVNIDGITFSIGIVFHLL